jgi:protein-L-isoaspartate(D-aspartate) O-methyltransferase
MLSHPEDTVSLEPVRAARLRTRLERWGIMDGRVLSAFASVPREYFVPPAVFSLAYEDTALPIGEGQILAEPYVVAAMTVALELTGRETVLEVGTGSGYSAAILSRLAAHVYTLEQLAPLADRAQERLRVLGCTNVRVEHADGGLGWREGAPYDAIVVGAASPCVPPTLLSQLAIGGRLLIPLGVDRDAQTLTRVRRRAELDYTIELLDSVCLTPLRGAAGLPESTATRGGRSAA